MSSNGKYTREGLLTLMSNNPEQIHDFTARFLTIKNESWITVGQLRVIDSKQVVAGHLNLPVHKLTLNMEELKEIKKGQVLSIKGVITTYNSGGTLRATLKGFADKQTIQMIEVK
jgi:hypothetical protein